MMVGDRLTLLVAVPAMGCASPGFKLTNTGRGFPVARLRVEPDNRGRRKEEDAIALAKAESKRNRKAMKRLAAVAVARG